MDDEELEPEVLSYREFRNRETLLAWERRRQAHESQPLGRGDRRRDPFMRVPRGAAAPAESPPR
jgi:hypothetical protein